MNRFGANLPYNLPGRQQCTLIWAQTPSSRTLLKYPFQENVEVALPTDAERNGNPQNDYRYLWIGLLPQNAEEFNNSAAVREVMKEKKAQEKERRKAWVEEVWKRMTREERKEWSAEDKANALMDGAIDARCLLDEDRYALRVVARIPTVDLTPSFAGGVQFHVLGREKSEIDVKTPCFPLLNRLKRNI